MAHCTSPGLSPALPTPAYCSLGPLCTSLVLSHTLTCCFSIPSLCLTH